MKNHHVRSVSQFYTTAAKFSILSEVGLYLHTSFTELGKLKICRDTISNIVSKIQMRKHFRGGIFHVFNRGNKKQPIFIDNKDYERFLSKLVDFRARTKDSIIQYCLLPNHYHLMIKAYSGKSISKLIQLLQCSHSKYMNSRYGFTGSFFQQRYKSKEVGSLIQLQVLSRYIHRNPVEYFSSNRALMEYPYSSYRSFLDSDTNAMLVGRSKRAVLDTFASMNDYKNFVESDELIIQAQIGSSVTRAFRLSF